MTAAAAEKNHTAKSVAAPVPIADADWQAGVTEDNHRFRPLLNSEPVPLAFAAKRGAKGWVECYVPARRSNRGEGEFVSRLLVPNTTRRLHGHVRLVRGDRC